MSLELEKYTPPDDVTTLRPLSKFERDNPDAFPDFYKPELKLREQLGTGRIKVVGHECIKPFGDLAFQAPANTIWKCEGCSRSYRRTTSSNANQQWSATKATALMPKKSNHPVRAVTGGTVVTLSAGIVLTVLTNIIVTLIAAGVLSVAAFLILPVLMLEDW